MLDDTTGRFTNRISTVTNVDLPHSFSGDSIPM